MPLWHEHWKLGSFFGGRGQDAYIIWTLYVVEVFLLLLHATKLQFLIRSEIHWITLNHNDSNFQCNKNVAVVAWTIVWMRQKSESKWNLERIELIAIVKISSSILTQVVLNFQFTFSQHWVHFPPEPLLTASPKNRRIRTYGPHELWSLTFPLNSVICIHHLIQVVKCHPVFSA